MHWDGDFFDHGTGFLQPPGRGHHGFIHIRFRARGAKAFAHDTDPQPLDPLTDELAIGFCLQRRHLTRVEAIVVARDDFE